MFKVMIADDEKYICDSMVNAIEKMNLSLEVLSPCFDGVEAFNTIIDEAPDIVITDIKMPGFNGLELIEKAKNINPNTEFIILSGYSEFEYAHKALAFSVKYYLLKPVTESEVKKALEETIHKIESDRNNVLISNSYEIMRKKNLYLSFKQYLMENIFASEKLNIHAPNLHPLNNFTVLYIYYLEPCALKNFNRKVLSRIDSFEYVLKIYVKNTLVMLPLFNDDETVDEIVAIADSFYTPEQSVKPVTEKKTFMSVEELVKELSYKLRRFGDVMMSDLNDDFTHYLNDACVVQDIETIIETSKENSDNAEKMCMDKMSQFTDEQLPVFFFQLLNGLRISCDNEDFFSNELNKTLDINNRKEIEELLLQCIHQFYKEFNRTQGYKPCVSEIISYSRNNLSEKDLSLKYIADNILFMNVDYLSREFRRETGKKYSAFLSELRVTRAKELLKVATDEDTIYSIAEQIGCYNPQYFSQLFKKYVGISPTVYIKNIHKGE